MTMPLSVRVLAAVAAYVWGVCGGCGASETGASSCDAASPDLCFNVWPDKVPDEFPGWPLGPETRSKTATGCGVTGNGDCNDITNVAVPTITAFPVENGTGAGIVIAPGGGYIYLAWEKEGIDVARMYNAMGLSAFVLKYRVPARPPRSGFAPYYAALQDAQRAVSMIRADAKKWNIDPEKLGFTGFSAGGHLTAHVSTAFDTKTYKSIDSIDKTSSRPDFSIMVYPWNVLPYNVPAKFGQAYSLSREFASINSKHPVSLFIHSEDDSTAPAAGSIVYFQKLNSVRKGTGARGGGLHIYPDGGHGYGLCQIKEEIDADKVSACEWPSVAKRFLLDIGALNN